MIDLLVGLLMAHSEPPTCYTTPTGTVQTLQAYSYGPGIVVTPPPMHRGFAR